MGVGGVFGDMIDEKLLSLHTAFIAKVIGTTGDSVCSVQPLDKIKAYGQTAKMQGVISRVPVLEHVSVKKDDIVLCVCAERDITSSRKGKSATPPVGHHQLKDAIVVGKLRG